MVSKDQDGHWQPNIGYIAIAIELPMLLQSHNAGINFFLHKILNVANLQRNAVARRCSNLTSNFIFSCKKQLLEFK